MFGIFKKKPNLSEISYSMTFDPKTPYGKIEIFPTVIQIPNYGGLWWPIPYINGKTILEHFPEHLVIENKGEEG